MNYEALLSVKNWRTLLQCLCIYLDLAFQGLDVCKLYHKVPITIGIRFS